MEKEIIREIRKQIDYSLNDKKRFVYNELSKKKEGNLIFIDGGNNNIFSTPSFNLSFIRTSAIFFENGIKKKVMINECYLLCEKERTRILKKNNEFSWLNPDLKINERNPEIFRRINEIFLANELFKSNLNAYIILDGSLFQQFKDNKEEKLILDLILKNNVNLFGLVKTNREFNDNGSIYGLIHKEAPENAWFTNPIKKEYINQIYTKLHKKSKYIFKIESFKEDIKEIENLLNMLSHNSSDPIFQGYPYGLILADKFAKVPNNEINLIKTKFLKLINDDSIEIELNTLNIHDKIDKINN